MTWQYTQIPQQMIKYNDKQTVLKWYQAVHQAQLSGDIPEKKESTMGGAPRTYACIQISEWKYLSHAAKVGSWEDQ